MALSPGGRSVSNDEVLRGGSKPDIGKAVIQLRVHITSFSSFLLLVCAAVVCAGCTSNPVQIAETNGKELAEKRDDASELSDRIEGIREPLPAGSEWGLSIPKNPVVMSIDLPPRVELPIAEEFVNYLGVRDESAEWFGRTAEYVRNELGKPREVRMERGHEIWIYCRLTFANEMLTCQTADVDFHRFLLKDGMVLKCVSGRIIGGVFEIVRERLQ